MMNILEIFASHPGEIIIIPEPMEEVIIIPEQNQEPVAKPSPVLGLEFFVGAFIVIAAGTILGIVLSRRLRAKQIKS
jgi:hypothetical protein